MHFYDRRGSYLAPWVDATCPSVNPKLFAAEDTRALIGQILGGGGVFPAGVWQITLPAWDQPMPPPHPRIGIRLDRTPHEIEAVADLLAARGWVGPRGLGAPPRPGAVADATPSPRSARPTLKASGGRLCMKGCR